MPRTKSKQPTKVGYVGVRVSEELKADLQQIAAAEARTVSQVCELLLASGIKQYKRLKSLDFAREKH